MFFQLTLTVDSFGNFYYFKKQFFKFNKIQHMKLDLIYPVVVLLVFLGKYLITIMLQ